MRKTITVVFSDVVGSTGLGEQLDPEAVRAVMGRYFEEMRAVLERHGGTVEKFIASRRRQGPLERLTPRELEVLALISEGRSNAGIAAALVLTVGAVEKHVANILMKLRLPPSQSDQRRVLPSSRTSRAAATTSDGRLSLC